MSLGRNLELCGRKVVRDFGFVEDANPPAEGAWQKRVVLSQENQSLTLPRYGILLRAVKAATVSAKARTLRYRFEVVVRSEADKRADESPEDIHQENVLLAHRALDDQAPGSVNQHPIVGLFNAARTALNLQCTVFLVVPIGEIEVARKDRAFYDAWGYVITCAEGVAT